MKTLAPLLTLICLATSLQAEEATGRIKRVLDYGPVVMIDFLEDDEDSTRSVFWAWPDEVKIYDEDGKAIPFAKIHLLKRRMVVITWSGERTPDARVIRAQY